MTKANRRRTLTGGMLLASLALLWPGASLQSQELDRLPAASPEENVLAVRREATQTELRALAQSIAEAREKAAGLQASIAGIEKTTASLREALVDSAARRKELDRKILASETRIEKLGTSEREVKASLLSRRGLLAEVLAALERMGRNPPPALLVTPDDALSSVRSAILLGAVVPGIRSETDKLAADLKSLSQLRIAMTREKQSFVTTTASAIEEERRMQLLLVENARLRDKNSADLERETKRAGELAARATTLESLITSLEREIASARNDALKAEQDRRQALTPEEREQAQRDADAGLPDKNRIAPAYPFSTLKAKLDLPVAGDVVRAFGDDDGTGHPAQGIMVAAGPGLIVTAPSDGWIVFAGPFRSYGQMIIMDAGDGYHIVMSGMDRVSARQGQFAVAGEPLGQMGDKRIASAAAVNLETERPTLYIEFRKDGKPVDSHAWWAIKDFGKARNDT